MKTDPRTIFPTLGPKYVAPREVQEEILWHIYTEKKPIVFLQAPTGIGKSGIAMCLADMLQAKTAVIATSTISLQEQYLRDFPALRILKGRSNFRCAEVPSVTAAEAPCVFRHGYSCANEYHTQEEEFLDPENTRFVTNYSLLLSDMLHGERWDRRRPDLLVLDEGHNLLNHLTQAETIVFDAELARSLGFKCPDMETIEGAQAWAKEKIDLVESRMHTARLTFGRNLRDLMRLFRQCEDTLSSKPSVGLIVTRTGKQLVASPMWPTNSGSLLLGLSPRVLVMSATLGDGNFLATVCGWPGNQTTSVAVPSPFPSDRWPVYFRPAVSLSKKSSPQEWQRMSAACHDLVHRYDGDSGIIHVASRRQVEYIGREILRCPTCRTRVVCLRSGERRAETIERFRANPSAVLIHPSVGEGESFDDEQCRFQIIAKIRYPDLGDKLTKLRAADGERGQKYYFHSTAAYTAQTVGRGMRHEEDWCDTYILDGSFAMLYTKNKEAFPEWFQRQLR